MKRPFVSVLFISTLLCSTFAYKILVYNSKFGHSNVNFYGNIADILVDAGHDVTSLMPEIDPACTNGTLKSRIILVPQTKDAKKTIDILHSEKVNWFTMDAMDPWQLFDDTPYADQFVHQCRGVLEEIELINRLREERFDVMIAENFDMCGIGLVPLIRPRALINGAASSPLTFMAPEFGFPLALSTNPSVTISHLDVHSFFSRLKNIYAEALGYKFFATSRSLVQQLFWDKFGPDFPSLMEISSRAAYTIINSEPLLDFATPILSRVVYVGGLGAREPKAVDEKLDAILSLRPRTVLISFGSIVPAHELDDSVKISIAQAVSRFPEVAFIWKYEQPDDAFSEAAKSIATNLHLIRWIPQNDILSDARIVAFVTHAGMGSTQELALRGKPGLFIPIFGDQMRNAGMMERSGVGKVFDKRDLVNSDKLAAAIKDLLGNNTYRVNAERLAAMIRKKPFSAREQLLNSVLNGNREMRPLLALIFLLFVTPSAPFKILVYNSKFGQSNGHFMGTIADILAEAGHNVTSLIPIIDPSFKDNTLKSHKIYVEQTEKTKQMTAFLNSDATNWFEANAFDYLTQFFVGTPYSDRFALQCEGMLRETELIERLRKEEYDVYISENFDMCGIGLVPLIKPRALINTAASSPIAWMSDEFGLPGALSYNPSPTVASVDIHSIFSRLMNFISEAMYYKFFHSSRWMIEDLFREKFGPTFPSLKEISSHAAYTLIYSEPLIDYAYPTLNRVVYVGGIGARPAQKLDEHYDRLLSLRPRTVLISFGTVVMTHRIPENVKRSIVEAVSRFSDVTFIWKYESPEDEFAKIANSIAPNLHLSKWIPQNDLLSDERLTAFITHGGAASTQEFMLKGKPGLSIPIFTDQPRNAGLLEKNGLGKMFDKLELVDTDKFTAAIKDLMENENYRENAKKLAAKLAKKPFSSKEQLIRTVEFAAEFGPSPALRPQSYDMSFIEYHNLDIIGMFVIIMVVMVSAFARIVLFLWRIVFRVKSKVE